MKIVWKSSFRITTDLAQVTGILFSFLWAESAYAADPLNSLHLSDEVRISAVTLTVVGAADERIVNAIGKAILQTGDLTVRADQMGLNQKNGIVSAEGNVTVDTAVDHFTGHTMLYDLSSRNAHITGATLVSPSSDLFVDAEQMWMLGPGHYVFRRARLSTCTCDIPEPPAFLVATTLEVQLGGYARMSWPVFYLNRIPVFSSPWLMIPVKRERQSGLLFPRFGFSKKEGFKIRPAVIIVPSDRTELYLEGLVASRWGIGGEGRAAYSAGGAHGWLAVTYLDELLKTVYPAFSLGSWLDPAAAITDRSATSAVTTPGTRAQRWTLSTFQEARLSRWGRLRLNSTLISDTRIYSDFAESLDSLTTDRVATTVEAVALAPRGGGALDMAVVSAVRTIDTTNLHRIPRLSFSWFPELIPGLGGYISGSLENDFVRARTAEFPLAPTAFVRQGLSGRTAMEISGRWRPTPGITLSLTGGPEGFLHIPDGHYQDLLLQGEFAAASIPTLTAQHAAAASNTTVAVRPRALLDTEVLLVRRYRHGVHQIGPFLEAAVEKLYGNLPDLVVWLNEEDGGYLGGKVGVRSYFQGLNWYHGIEMYYTAVATGTDLFGSDSWPLPTAWHARGWGGGGPLTVWAHVAGLRGAPERLDASLLYQPYILGGQWAFELGYSQITHGYRWDSPLWYNPAGGGRLYFSDDRIAEDLTGRMVARIIPELGLSFTYRYSLTRSELVYWRAGTNLSSSCQCWQVQLGYSRLIAPGTDRFEFAFQMVGLGGASLE